MIRIQAPFVLASRSPRRSELLTRLGFAFAIAPSEVDEDVPAGTPPTTAVEDLALRKARHVATSHPDALVLGADTIVVLDDEILGKPADDAGARTMLSALSGKTHTVYSGIGLVHLPTGRAVAASERTEVTFGELSPNEIAAYVRTGSPLDKAGAYGIQDDLGAFLVERIEGDYYNVVGLPLRCLYRTLRAEFADLVGPID